MSSSEEYRGIVQKGARRGSALGYPTVNIPMTEGDADGIYAARVSVGAVEYLAAAFADPARGVLEAHILSFFGDLYDKEIAITLEKKIRDTETFHADVDLRNAIAEDVQAVRQYFSA